MRELMFVKAGTLRWRDVAEPSLSCATDALVRPFIAARCDGDAFYLRHNLRKLLAAGAMLHVVDPGFRRAETDPFAGPFLKSATLHVSVAHARADLPALLALLQRGTFDPSIVTSLVAPWDDAPTALLERSTKVVLRREPLRQRAA